MLGRFRCGRRRREPCGAIERATSGTDALILMGCIIVAAISMAHARNRLRLERERDALRIQSDQDTTLIGSLRTHVGALRTRHDRVDLAISYWRDIAGRLEGDDDSAAAKAALELSIQRTGARAGLVRRFDGAGLHNVAFRGRWSEAMPTPRDIFRDVTMTAAIERATTVVADEVRGTGVDDADIAAAVTARDGTVVGVIALRGISRSALRAADIRDLTATAQWLAIALAPDDIRPDMRTVTPRRHAGFAAPQVRAATEPGTR